MEGDSEQTDIVGPDTFLNGDLFATLVCNADRTVSLAILKSMTIEEKGKSVENVRATLGGVSHSAPGRGDPKMSI